MLGEATFSINLGEGDSLSPTDLKLILRQIAKKHPLYFKRVENPYNGEANTLGRILFGIPGFAGLYCQRVGKGGEVRVGIEKHRSALFPEEIVKEIVSLLRDTVNAFEKRRQEGNITNRTNRRGRSTTRRNRNPGL